MDVAADAGTTSNAVALDQVYEALRSVDKAWLESTLRKRWEAVKPSEHKPAKASGDSSPNDTAVSTATLPHQWRRQSNSARLDNTTGNWSYIDKINTHDWSATALGPLSAWSSDLQRLLNICLSLPMPAMIFWGPDRCCLFNEAYGPMLDGRVWQTQGLPLDKIQLQYLRNGNPYSDAIAELIRTGLPVHAKSACFFVDKDGMPTEFWSSFSFTPIITSSGIKACLNTVTDLTQDVVGRRRARLLADLRRECATVTSLASFGTSVLHALEDYDRDIPFAAVYQRLHFEHAQSSHAALLALDAGDMTAITEPLTLTGFLGPPPTSSAIQLPSTLVGDAAFNLLGSALATAMDSAEVQILQLSMHGDLAIFKQHAKSRAWSEDCRTILLIPVRERRSKTVTCLFILGVNSRLPYDEDYKHFVSLLHSHLHFTIDSLFVTQERQLLINRGEQLAVNEQLLTKDLESAKEDNKYIEMRFHRMADRSPVGMFEVGASGELKYANDAWYEMAAHSRDKLGPLEWVEVIHPDDRAWFAETWSRLVAGDTLDFEIRFCKPFTSDDYVDGQRLEGVTWIAASAYAERDSAGRVVNVLGTTADISRHKWLEGFQERRALEALELKKRQEAFVDMISHEARNPLSAITLCAESSLSLLSTEDVRTSQQSEVIQAALDDLKTILACAHHQKSVIDDVLTLSKINTGMLAVCPVPVQPKELIRSTLATFAPSISQADIQVHNITDPSCGELGLEWVLLDPVRLQQILINLISNAIKFTRDNTERRMITITLSAHTVPPSMSSHAGKLPPSNRRASGTSRSASAVFLKVAVEDTGCGIQPEHVERLFERFTQGPSKTHVKYGGSGLGLHICRVLAELQGGQIDVSSVHLQGSTFTFFIQTERCPAPLLAEDNITSSNVVNSSSNDASPPPKATAGHATKRNHILLVEDNLVNQRVMTKHLQRLGFHVVVANHGQEALDHLATTKACVEEGLELDLVMMDIEMPVMDGLTCVKIIRQRMQQTGKKLKLPVIAVTANARKEQQDIALEAGFDAVITKPFRIKELESMLAQYGLCTSV